MKAKNSDRQRYAQQRYTIRKQLIDVLHGPDTLTNAQHALHQALIKHGVDLSSQHLRIAAKAVLALAAGALANANQVRPKRNPRCTATTTTRHTDRWKYTKLTVRHCVLDRDHEGHHCARINNGHGPRTLLYWPTRQLASRLILDAIIGGATRPIDIARLTDIPHRAVSSYLNHLLKTEQVYSPKRGEWRITGKTCSESK